MATKAADSAMEDIANSLTEAEVVPTKLRCAICDKVAFNAFKLPCCDQNICANCQSSLPEACPICQHSPLNADDAKPSKSLRLTVAQFLKSVKKKREKVQIVPGGDTTPTPGAGPSTPVTEAIPAAVVDATLEPSEVPVGAVEPTEASPLNEQLELDPKQEIEASAERVAEEDAELQQLEATTAITQPDHNNENEAESVADDDEEDAESDTSEIIIVTGDEEITAANPWGEQQEEEYQEEEQWNDQDGQDQMQGQGYDYQGGDQGDMSQMFGNMGPDMMQMMMQQMNGMQNGNWPNMMGMPNMGMGMNPMDMFAAFGMQGMGGMNPNMMSMNGMNGMMGMDFNNSFGNGGWNGQQMNGDYGASTGYYPDGGYNQSSHQGNYPSHNRHNQQFSMKNDSFHNQRGSFRGRGYGRGYLNNQNYHGRSHSQNFPGADNAPPPNAPTGPRAQREATEGQYQQAHNHISAKPGLDRQHQPSATDAGANKDATNTNNQQVSDRALDTGTESASEQLAQDQPPEELSKIPADLAPDRGSDYFNRTNGTPTEAQYEQQSYRGGYRGRGSEGRGAWRGRGSYHGSRGSDAHPTPPAEAAGPGVEGAPSGPKAMREGNSWAGRGRGSFHGAGRGQSQSMASTKPEDLPERRPRSRTRSNSPSRDTSRSASHRHSKRHRSRTPSSDSDHERRKERRRRRSERKHEDDHDERHADERDFDEGNDDKYRSSRREHDRHRSSRKSRESSRERRKHRRRSRSPEDQRDEQHMSINGDDADSKDKDRRRERDKYRDRSRDRDRYREKDRDRERDKKRSSKRDRSASPDSQQRSSHRRDKEREKDKEREQRDKESRRPSAASISKPTRSDTVSVQKQLEQGFRIHGRSRDKERDRIKAEATAAADTVPQPAPAMPASFHTESSKMQPPTGPRGDRSSGGSRFKIDIANLNTKSTPSASRRQSQSATPTSAVTPKEDKPLDPYEQERRKAQEARIAKELSRRKGSDAGTGGLTKKRSWADVGGGEEENAPTGPRDKKRPKGRKMSYKYEDDGDIGRGEGERESARYR